MEYTALTEVFGDKLTYIIPPYQRPYSWDCIGKSEKNNQINIMWDDIYNYFIEKNKGLYFMGSMVLIPNSENERLFEVIDGQQRLTSMTLLIVSIKCFLSKMIGDNKKIEPDPELDEIIKEAKREVESVIYNKQLFGSVTIEKKVKIEKNAEFDYDIVLKNVLECSEEPKNEDLNNIYHFTTEEQKKIILRYYKNRKYFENQIEQNFLTNKKFTVADFAKLNDFLDFIKTKISFVIIKAKDFEFAYRIFETLNNRGLPLSNKDLFRNFVIEKFAEVARENNTINPTAKWNELDTNFELKEDFLGRWVESKKASQQKLSAFNDLKEEIYNTQHYYKDDLITKKKKIDFLYADIKEDLNYYTMISKPELINDKKIRNKINFLHNCGNNRYTINLLLSIFRHYKYQGNENTDLENFITIYEKFVLYTLLNPAKRFSNGPIYKAIKHINSGNLNEAQNEFTEFTDDNELKDFMDSKIKDNEIAKLLISKYIWYLQANRKNDVVSQILHYDVATLEHIIPQKPDLNTNWLTDFSQDFRLEFTYKLGNMTLLNQALNSGAKNYDYSIKKEKYKETNLSFTTDIIKDTINEDFISQRQNLILIGLCNDLNINA